MTERHTYLQDGSEHACGDTIPLHQAAADWSKRTLDEGYALLTLRLLAHEHTLSCPRERQKTYSLLQALCWTCHQISPMIYLKLHYLDFV